jgi:hypothetical protein
MNCYSCNGGLNHMQGKMIPNVPTTTPPSGTEGGQKGYPAAPSSINLGTAPAPIKHEGGRGGDAMAGKGKS